MHCTLSSVCGGGFGWIVMLNEPGRSVERSGAEAYPSPGPVEQTGAGESRHRGEGPARDRRPAGGARNGRLLHGGQL